MLMNAYTKQFCVFTAAIAVIAGDSPAQHALGDGTALDANSRVGSGGRNVRANTFMQDMALRNAIVTGTAASGRSFRGSVGYESADAFRGALGSDDIYAFQRDSFYSGLATSDVRGLSGLQYSMAQTMSGQALDLYGTSLIVRRPGGGMTSSELGVENSQGYVPEYDAFGRTRGALRSTADFLSSSFDAPSMLSLGKDASGIERVQVASALSGVKWVRQDNGLMGVGDRFLKPKIEDELELQRPASPHHELVDRLRIEAQRIDLGKILPDRVEPAPGEPDVEGEDSPDPDNATVRQDALDRIFDAMRIELEVRPPTESTPQEEDASIVDADEMRERTRRQLIQELTGMVARDGIKIERLIRTGTNVDLYQLHMTKGQEALMEGRWFDAEERFSHAIRQEPGDSMAAAGRVHAQLGAGMIRSGGANLRNLFAAYPELVSVRYSADLLPSGEASNKIKAQLNDRIDRKTAVAHEAAILLAYLGFQTDDRPSIERGLSTLESEYQMQQPGVGAMVELLRAAWLREGE
jgi:hypothetical protein